MVASCSRISVSGFSVDAELVSDMEREAMGVSHFSDVKTKY